MAAPSASHDLVLFGATSFAGQILTAYLVDRLGTDGNVSWAIAGRDEGKLEDLAERTGADVPILVADATSISDMGTLAASTSTIISTVGPYALYGSELVAAAAAAGTDYCDLTGEPQWVRKMIDAHHDTAVASGARIVPSCGFDSVPSDLGVWFTQQQAVEQLGAPCSQIRMQVVSAKGGASGGTIASMLNVVEEASRDKELRSLLADPYALAPADLRSGPPQINVTTPKLDEETGQWLAPFVMAGINTKVVFRTHALLGRPWGPDFRYDEAMAMGEGASGRGKALGLAAGLGAGMGLLAMSPTRKLVERFLPEPGEGPSPEKQEAGGYVLRFYGTTDDGQRIATQVTGDRDPGYGSTARILGEAALCFGSSDVAGGFWTPASAFGEALVERLVEHAGLTFEVV